MKKYLDNFNEQLTRYLPASRQLFFYWKGRVALYSILKSAGISSGDEVILPAYTCVVVPNQIIYLGAKPVYVDVDRQTYNMDVSKLAEAITEKTKAVICQNTYGLSSNLEEIAAIAKACKLLTIEDCCHGFGGTYKGKPNGSYCDAAFFSTQWNKPFSTGLGGFALINNQTIFDKMSSLYNQKSEPGFKAELVLRVLYFVRRYFLCDSSYWLLLRLYRFLSRHNLIIGSSQGIEITSTDIPDNFFRGFSTAQAREGLKNLKELPYVMELRKNNARHYNEFLMRNGKVHIKKEHFKNHSFLKYPILVNDRKKFFALAEKSKIRLGDWFISPLHPVESGFDKWYFETDRYPIAVELADKVVNIPTDIKNPENVLKFLESNMGLIE
ncbi:MAG: hypothetical protein GY730_00200 [bacterium]|nr:hypothetical protein [bacterium]